MFSRLGGGCLGHSRASFSDSRRTCFLSHGALLAGQASLPSWWDWSQAWSGKHGATAPGQLDMGPTNHSSRRSARLNSGVGPQGKIMRGVAQALLFCPLLVGYWYVHGLLSVWVAWVPELFTNRPYRLAGLLIGVVLCGVLSGLLFCGP